MTAQGDIGWRAKVADFAGMSQERADAHAATVQPKPAGHWVRGPRTPLTANQHILHLLLTVFTAGLWGIVWIIRGTQGNRPWVWVPD